MQQVAKDERGFSIIELLVVVIIMGILASIAIPAFLNQREKTHIALVKSDVRNAVLSDTARRSGQGTGLAADTYTEGQNLGDAENAFQVSRGGTVTVTATEIVGTHAGLTAADTWSYDRVGGAYQGAGVFN